MKQRLTRNSLLICNLDMDWGSGNPLCRDEVMNNPGSISEHMIKKHGWNKIPELALRELKTKKDKKLLLEKYNEKPEEWFFDNQLIWSEFRSFHFKR